MGNDNQEKAGDVVGDKTTEKIFSRITAEYSGSVPLPTMAKQYEEMHPGSIDFFFRLASESLEHERMVLENQRLNIERHYEERSRNIQLREKIVEANVIGKKRDDVIAVLFFAGAVLWSILVLGAAVYLVLSDKDIQALVAAVAAVVPIFKIMFGKK